MARGITRIATIWIIDSELNLHHLNQTEKEKLWPLYYEYSSESDYKSQTFTPEKRDDAHLKHGTVMFKVASIVSSKGWAEGATY